MGSFYFSYHTLINIRLGPILNKALNRAPGFTFAQSAAFPKYLTPLLASFPPSHHLRKPHVVSTMLGFASTDATGASVSTSPVSIPDDLTKNKLITNISYFENTALVSKSNQY